MLHLREGPDLELAKYWDEINLTHAPPRLRSHGLVVRAVACEARGAGFNSSSDQKVFSLLEYKVVGIKWIQT